METSKPKSVNPIILNIGLTQLDSEASNYSKTSLKTKQKEIKAI